MSPRNQHPFGRLLQQLRGKLATNGVKQIVSSEHDRILLHLNWKDVMLKNESARQHRQRLAIDFLGIERHHGHPEEIPDRSEKPGLINFSGIQNLADPGSAV